MIKKFLFLFITLAIFLPHTAQARKLFYAEEFYLYVLNLYQTNPNHMRNIRFLQWALEAPFDNPVRSLALITTEDEFNRYKALFKMHVNLLIIDSYLQLAKRFDKQHVYFFNLKYAKDLEKSFTVARYFYQMGLNYWDEVKKHASEASKIHARIDIDAWEDELFLIEEGELDYEATINLHLQKLEAHYQIVKTFLESDT